MNIPHLNWRRDGSIIPELRELYMPRPLIPILPRNGMYLTALAGDGRRFAGLFARTWRKIPLGVRRRLLCYWRTCGVNLANPEIKLVRFWAGQNGHQYALCTHTGHTLKFWAQAMDVLPDDLIQVVIAHELGHAFFDASDTLSGRIDQVHRSYTYAHDWEAALDEDRDVADLLWLWGFDDDTLDEWSAKNPGLLPRLWAQQSHEPLMVCAPGIGGQIHDIKSQRARAIGSSLGVPTRSEQNPATVTQGAGHGA